MSFPPSGCLVPVLWFGLYLSTSLAGGETPSSDPDPYRAAFELSHQIVGRGGLQSAVRAGRERHFPPDSSFWTNSPVGQIGRALDLLHDAVDAGPLEWKVDWEEEGFDGLPRIPEILPRLAEMTTTYHEFLLDLGQGERIPRDVQALVGTARSSVQGNLLIHYRGALASEIALLDFLAENAGRMPEEILRELGGVLEKLPPLPSLREVVDWEAAVLRGQLWNLLAGVSEGAVPETLPAGELRVSSMVALGPDDVTIGFETPQGESFTLRPGQRRRNYELVTVDLKEGRAILRKGADMFVVELGSRTTRSVELDAGWDRVETYLRNGGLWYPEIENIVRRARGDRARAFHEVLAQFEKDFETIRSIWKMPVDRMPPPSFSPETSFVQSTVPLYISTRRLEHRHRARHELLAAAVAHLQKPEENLPASRIADQPIKLHREADKLIFLSPLLRDGAPISLEVALPNP